MGTTIEQGSMKNLTVLRPPIDMKSTSHNYCQLRYLENYGRENSPYPKPSWFSLNSPILGKTSRKKGKR